MSNTPAATDAVCSPCTHSPSGSVGWGPSSGCCSGSPRAWCSHKGSLAWRRRRPRLCLRRRTSWVFTRYMTQLKQKTCMHAGCCICVCNTHTQHFASEISREEELGNSRIYWTVGFIELVQNFEGLYWSPSASAACRNATVAVYLHPHYHQQLLSGVQLLVPLQNQQWFWQTVLTKH